MENGGLYITGNGADRLDAHVVWQQLGYDTRCENPINLFVWRVITMGINFIQVLSAIISVKICAFFVTIIAKVAAIIMVCELHHIMLMIDGFTDKSRCCAAYGEGSGPIHMNNLACLGAEFRLVDCRYSHNTYEHYSDWSVICYNGRLFVSMCW